MKLYLLIFVMILSCFSLNAFASKNKKCFDAGIIAKKEVLSVLVCKGENKDDFESNTSNILAKILNQQGEIVIGDKALKRYYNSNDCQDLAKLWYEKYHLPFVFARFCVNKNYKKYEKIINKFLNTKIYIEKYIYIEWHFKAFLRVNTRKSVHSSNFLKKGNKW